MMKNCGTEDNPVVSVIIPVYNVERYLERCVESVRHQSYKNLEIILIDDGSTDGSGYLCDLLAEKDGRIQVIHQENRGLSAARNRGLEIAGGDLIGFVDSDDFISPAMYWHLVRIMKEYQADIASCKYKLTGANGYQAAHAPSDDRGKTEISDGDGALITLLRSTVRGGAAQVSCGSRLYKKEIIGENRFREGMMYEDILFNWYVLQRAKQVVSSRRILYYYYARDGSLTRAAFSDRYYDLLCLGEEILRASRTKPAAIQKLCGQLNCKCHYSLLMKGIRTGNRDVIQTEAAYMKENYKTLLLSDLSLSRKAALAAVKLLPVPLQVNLAVLWGKNAK